jgi:hypothetical protein
LIVLTILLPTQSSGLRVKNADNLLKDGRRFPLSPGERAWVRASVHQKVPSENNLLKLTLRFGWFAYQKPGLSFSNFF